MDDFSNKKVLIFSDTHLTCKFEEERFSALKEIIKEADIVIINGDFWEYISCSFKKFVKSEWGEKLFPLLKEKEKTIFLHGNHDSKRYMSIEGIKKFAHRREKDFRFKSGDKIFKVEHGDLLAQEFDVHHYHISRLVQLFMPWFYLWLVRLENKKYILGRVFKKYMSWKRKKDTQNFEKFIQDNFEENVIRVFGHIHEPKHNLDNNFLILGPFLAGKKNYIFIENGEVKFFSGNYE